MGFRVFFDRIRKSYVQFVEKQGFPIIVTVCTGVIVATAVWTGSREHVYTAPTPPPSGDISAAQLIQQSLRSAVPATPIPVQTPRPWHPPLDEIRILRPFDTSCMVKGALTELWYFHDAVDLAAASGSRVYAIADGTVSAAGKDQLLGEWLRIDHDNGVEAFYAGMVLTEPYIVGDRVFGGDTIGYVGKGIQDETDLPAHLHLQVTKDGLPIDPSMLW